MLAKLHIPAARYLLFATIMLGGCFKCLAQSFEVEPQFRNVRIPFTLIRNMVVIKLRVNDRGPFNFILDTGVGLMLMTDPAMVDSIGLTQKRTIKITGLGDEGDVEAYVTPELKLSIPGLTSNSISAAILKKDYFNLSSYVGEPVHGLIGWEFFNSLAVKVDLADSTLTVCRPQDLRKFRKSQRVPLSIEDKKPYIETWVTMPDGQIAKKKLVVDLGAGHPLSLEGIPVSTLPVTLIKANLGVALNGPINGSLSRIPQIELGKYKIKNVITSFPDADYSGRTFAVPRNGNLGIGILKRFTVIFDYTNSMLYLKPNNKYNEPFEHDMSGIEYYAAGEGLKHLIVSRVEPGSPADEIGIERGDEIVSINFKPVSQMSVEEVDSIFRSRNDRSLLLEVYHDKKYDRVVLTLKRRV